MSILAFSKKYKDGVPTLFKPKIQIGQKKHTFRMNFSRKVGQCIHFYEGHPRVANSEAMPFHVDYDKAEFWKHDDKGGNMPVIAAIEKWSMNFINPELGPECRFIIGEMVVSEFILEAVSLGDGFETSISFLEWFKNQAIKKNVTELSGQLIHWNSHTVYDAENAEFYKPDLTCKQCKEPIEEGFRFCSGECKQYYYR